MKHSKFLIATLALFTAANVYATPIKTVHLPFQNELIYSKDHDGLLFKYDLTSANKKIVCQLSYVYKGWLEYEYEGNLSYSGTYGNANGIDTLTLISNGTHAEDVYIVDEKGLVFVNAVKHEKAPLAAASCQYESV